MTFSTTSDSPKNYKSWKSLSQPNHPFFVKEYGYSAQKKLVIDDYNHNDIFILFSISGVARFTTHKDTTYINPNTLIFSACNKPLIFNKVSKTWEFFYVIIGGSHAKLYYNLIRDKTNLFTINPLTSHLPDYFMRILNLDTYSSIQQEMLSCKLSHQVLYDLYLISYDIMQSKKLIPIQETDINIALEFIANHYQEEISIETICQQVHLSKYYFCKIFKAHTGTTIHQYLTHYRINKSKELLSYSKISIKAIASTVGFNNSLTYIRCFEKIMDMTPSEYRNNY